MRRKLLVIFFKPGATKNMKLVAKILQIILQTFCFDTESIVPDGRPAAFRPWNARCRSFCIGATSWTRNSSVQVFHRSNRRRLLRGLRWKKTVELSTNFTVKDLAPINIWQRFPVINIPCIWQEKPNFFKNTCVRH